MMSLRTYWYSLKQSVSTPAYYRDVLRSPLWFNFKFFALTMLFVSIIASLAWRIQELPNSLQALSNQIDLASKELPAGASIDLARGDLKTQNLKDPFTFTSTQAIKELSFPKDLIVITTDEEMKSAAFVTLRPKSALIRLTTIDDTSGDFVIKYKEIAPDLALHITKDVLSTQKDVFIGELKKLTIVLQLISFPLLYLSFIIATIFPIAIFALFSELSAWALGLRFTYKGMLGISFHVMSVATLINEISTLFVKTDFPFLPIAFFGMMAIILLDLRKGKLV